MEPEGSLPCSQESSTGPYCEPDQASPYHPMPSLLRSILLSPTHLRLGLPSGQSKSLKLRGFSPQANYTNWATAACRRS
jgi:hypothetical protein